MCVVGRTPRLCARCGRLAKQCAARVATPPPRLAKAPQLLINERIAPGGAPMWSHVRGGRCGGMPLSIPPIIGSELCERWAYYSVRAVLVLFLTSRLGYSDDGAVATYSYWVAASYLSPFLGGYLADARTGRFATIVIFSAIYLVGMCALAASAAGAAASAGGVLAGLALSALGTGGIKPCVSAFGVDQLLLAPGAAAAAGAGGAAAGATLVSRYFLLFYFSINAGSTLSFIVTPLVRVAAGFDAAFWLSAAVLALALAFFLAGTPLYVRLPPGGRSVYASFARVFAASWRAGCGRAGAGGGAGAGADGYRESAPLMPAAAAATAPQPIISPQRRQYRGGPR